MRRLNGPGWCAPAFAARDGLRSYRSSNAGPPPRQWSRQFGPSSIAPSRNSPRTSHFTLCRCALSVDCRNRSRFFLRVPNTLAHLQRVERQLRTMWRRRTRGGSASPPVVVIVNYHRVGQIDPHNPFHTLHTVSESTFLSQIESLERFGKWVSLDDVIRNDALGPLNFAITFDDVSIAAKNGIRHLRERNIPYSLAVCTLLADNGYGTRDKVYAIQKCLPEEELRSRVAALLGAEYVQPGFSFYRFTKSDVVGPSEMARELIDPVFEEIRPRVADYFGQRWYLSWVDLREMLDTDPLMTLANHGSRHDNMTALSRVERQQDVLESHRHIIAELGLSPRYFAVPFGGRSPDLMSDLEAAGAAVEYDAILWVEGASNTVRSAHAEGPAHLLRIHAPTSPQGLSRTLRAALRNAAVCEVSGMSRTAH